MTYPLDLRPLDHGPAAIRPPYDVRLPRDPWVDLPAMRADHLGALHEPLTGITLGSYDRRLLAWLAGWDIPTIGGIGSLLHRARAATPLDVVTDSGGQR